MSPSGVTFLQEGQTLVVRINRAELVDPAFIADVQFQAMDHIARDGRPQVLLDLSGVRVASSAAVGLTLALHRAVDEAKGQLAIVVFDESVRAVFERCRIDTLFELHKEKESALRSLARQD